MGSEQEKTTKQTKNRETSYTKEVGKDHQTPVKRNKRGEECKDLSRG